MNRKHDSEMYRHHGWYGGGHPLLGWFFTLLLLALLVVLVAAAVRWLVDARRRPAPSAGSGWRAGDDALAIARARYARGEIDREAFLRITEDLTASEPRHAGPP